MAATAVSPGATTQIPLNGSLQDSAGRSAALPTTAAEFSSLRDEIAVQGPRKHEEAKDRFGKNYIAQAQAFVDQSALEVKRLTEEKERSAFSIFHPSTWFGGTQRSNIAQQLETAKEIHAASVKKVETLNERVRYSDAVAQAGEQVYLRAEQLRQSGRTQEAGELFQVASGLKELAPAILPISDAAFAQIQTQLSGTIRLAGSMGNTPPRDLIADMKRGVYTASAVFQSWQSQLDPNSGRLVTVSTAPDIKAQLARLEELRAQAVATTATTEARHQYWKIGVGLAVAATAIMLSGPILVGTIPFWLGGAFSSGILGALVGVAAGTAVGAAAAYSEQVANALTTGRANWAEAWADTKGYAGTAVWSVAAGKVFSAIGAAAGALEGFAYRGAQAFIERTPWTWTAKVVAKAFPLMRPAAVVGVSGVGTYTASYYNGHFHQLEARKKFAEVVSQESPELKLDKKAYFDAEKKYLSAMGISDGDLHRMAWIDAGVGALSGWLHLRFPTSALNTPLPARGRLLAILGRGTTVGRQEGTKLAVSAGAGLAAEWTASTLDNLDGESNFSAPLDDHAITRLMLSSLAGRQFAGGMTNTYPYASGIRVPADMPKTLAIVGGEVVPAFSIPALASLTFPGKGKSKDGADTK